MLIRAGNASRTGRAALLQPLAEVELTAYLREGKDLATLREVALIEPHLPLREKIDRLALASFLLDVALETSFPGQECGETYDLLRVALAAV